MSEENNENQESGDNEVVETEDPVDAALAFVAGILEHGGWSSTASVEVEKGVLNVAIDGEDAGELLVQPSGARTADTLEAIATLIRLAPMRGSNLSVSVDADNYREGRVDYFEHLASSLADKARDGKEIAVYGMNSIDRRAVHRQLSNHEGVETNSVGNGVYRCLNLRVAD